MPATDDPASGRASSARCCHSRSSSA